MSEAAGALLRFSFEDLRLHRVCAHARAEISGSVKIMEKYGMRREGHYIQCDPVRFAETEAWADVYLYAMLDTEYFTARQQDHHGAERL
jgi:RimJ/RimL family protein N-acetyltransferase